MKEYISELSKYFITICMALYTLESFMVFRFKEEKSRKGIYFRQNILLFLIQLASFLTLYVKSDNIEFMLFWIIVQLLLFGTMAMVPMLYPKCNHLLVNNMCMLLGIGFIILARISFQNAMKQMVIVIVSICIAMAVPYALEKCTFLKKMTWLYAAIGAGALTIVLVLGEITHGSKLSFSLAGISIQPSEFVKILFVFFLAGALFEDTSFVRVCITTIVAAVHVLVLVLSKDLGSALIFFVVFVFIVFVATRNYFYLLLGVCGGIASTYVANMLFRHVQVRFQAWLDPWSYIDTQGYQITQSLFAIGSGSWFGLGLLGGTPDDIPYVQADFVFSAVCEEMGVVFGFCLILICVNCFIMMMNISALMKDKFYQLIALGLGCTYIFQVFLTIGGGIKFIPLTGVTLPFISHGGSSILSSLLIFFIIQGFYLIRQKEEAKRVLKKKRRRVRPTYTTEYEIQGEEKDES